jgi:hypothetical protein
MQLPTRPASLQVHGCALLSYAAVALFFSWPLPLDLGGRLTGPVGGDTGTYVWNIWVFRHELIGHGRFPLFTQEIFSLTPPVALGLHNYTLFADLLAFPLIPLFGVIATFNVIYLALSVLTAWSMFALARSVVGRTAEAWLAGLLFGFSPILIARGTAHFSLAVAAPLPIFLLLLRRAERDHRPRHAVAAGVAVAWASTCDPYYGVFCIVIALSYFTARYVRVDFATSRPPLGAVSARVVDALLIVVTGVTASIIASGGMAFQIGRHTVEMRTLYTPVLILSILLIARTCLWLRPAFRLRLPPPGVVLRFVFFAGAACTLLLSPVLFALWHNLADGGVLHGPTLWRSSPAGVDLLALFAPNPNHALLGGPWRHWLGTRPNGYAENVASLTIAGVAVIAIAVWRYRFRPPRVWVGLTAFFAALALGPFVHVGGFNTFVPGPWALLRYLPVITATRMPSRYAVPLMMLFSLLFALALVRITEHRPARRRAVLVAVGAALAFELTPFPRPLYSARVPDLYRTIANDPREVRVLELPYGFADGEWSEGRYTPAKQFYQTVHQKPLIGGALSRISPREIERQHQSVTIRHLIRLSEGDQLSQQDLEEVKRRAPGFVDRTRLGYFVIDVGRTPPAFREFAIEAYGLVKLGESGGHELYAPTVGTPTAAVR